MTKEEIIQDILKGMEGIGGIPSNQEFYAEFDFRLRSALGIESENERLKAEMEKNKQRDNFWFNTFNDRHPDEVSEILNIDFESQPTKQ